MSKEEAVAAATRLVEGFLIEHGLDPAACAEEPEAARLAEWSAQQGSARLYLAIAELEDGEPIIEIYSPIVYVPEEGRGALYEHLLEQNVGLPDMAFGLDDGVVILVASRDAASLDAAELKKLALAVGVTADDFDDELVDEFGCKMVGDPAANR